MRPVWSLQPDGLKLFLHGCLRLSKGYRLFCVRKGDNINENQSTSLPLLVSVIQRGRLDSSYLTLRPLCRINSFETVLPLSS